jgi:hypothetical protein
MVVYRTFSGALPPERPIRNSVPETDQALSEGNSSVRPEQEEGTLAFSLLEVAMEIDGSEVCLVAGLDIGKKHLQVHVCTMDGTFVQKARIARDEVCEFFRGLPRSLVAMEASSMCHYWVQQLSALGHVPRLYGTGFLLSFVPAGRRLTRVTQHSWRLQPDCQISGQFRPSLWIN